jgi:hypothetical protein
MLQASRSLADRLLFAALLAAAVCPALQFYAPAAPAPAMLAAPPAWGLQGAAATFAPQATGLARRQSVGVYLYMHT